MPERGSIFVDHAWVGVGRVGDSVERGIRFLTCLGGRTRVPLEHPRGNQLHGCPAEIILIFIVEDTLEGKLYIDIALINLELYRVRFIA